VRVRTNLASPITSQHHDRHDVSGHSQNAQRADDDCVEDELVELAVDGGRTSVRLNGEGEVDDTGDVLR